jgi:3-oxoadipate enol-lactonase
LNGRDIGAYCRRTAELPSVFVWLQHQAGADEIGTQGDQLSMGNDQPNEGFLDVEGGRIHYCVDGKRDAPALVMSNSLGTDLSMWEPQMPALLRHFRVVRYDGRGHGASAAGSGEYSIERLAKDVLSLIDCLAIRTASFCGLSMGGMVGMWLALNAPERLNKLLLCSTGAKIGTADGWNARIDAVRKNGMAAIAEGVLQRWFTAPFLEKERATVDRVRRLLLAIPPDAYAATCVAIRDADLRDAIARIRAQTLVVSGSRDVATPPADGRFLAERIPGARYVELEAAHLSNIEAPRQFTEEVLRFLVPEERSDGRA